PDPGENSWRSNVRRRDAQIAARIFAETNFRARGAGPDVEGRKVKVRRRVARSLRRRRADLSGFAFYPDYQTTRRKDSGSEPDWRFVVAAVRELAQTVH